METLAGFRSVCVVDMMRLLLWLMTMMMMGFIVYRTCDSENEISLSILQCFVLVVRKVYYSAWCLRFLFAFVVNFRLTYINDTDFFFV